MSKSNSLRARNSCLTLLLGAAASLLPAVVQAQGDANGAVTAAPVVVTATRIPTNPAQLGSSVSIITRQQLERRQITFVGDALRTIPGVTIQQAGNPGNRTTVRIRGSDTNQVLVLIDGVRINNLRADDSVDLGNLLTADVQRIEVVRGPQSVLYGSNAVGGVINIITRKGRPGLHARALFEGGAMNTRHAALNVSGGSKKVDFAASFERFLTDGISTAAGNSELDGNASSNASLRISAHPSSTSEFTVIARGTRAVTATDEGINTPYFDPNHQLHTNNGFLRLQGKLTSAGGRLDQRFGIESTHSDFTDYGSTSTYTSSGSHRAVDYQASYFFNARDVLTAGTQWSRDAATNNSGSGLTYNTVAGYANYRFSPSRPWDLGIGLREDHNTQFGGFTSYRLTASYRAWAGTRFHASLGRGFSLPTFTEQAYGHNPNLRPERSTGVDFGIDQALLNQHAHLSLTVFDNRISDLIEFVGNNAYNVDKARIRGIEASGRVDLTANWHLSADLTYQQPRNVATDQDLLERPRRKASLNLDYSAGRLSAFAQLHYEGPRPDTGNVRLGGYSVTDIGVSYRIDRSVELTGRINNLFNRHYQEFAGYNTPGFAGYVGVRVKL